MYWIIPLLLAFLCTLVNPYLGLMEMPRKRQILHPDM